MFRIDKSTVGSIDKKNPYVMQGIFVRPAKPADELPPELEIETPLTDDPALAALQEKQIKSANAAAAKIVEDAQRQAQDIHAEAEAGAEELRASAWREGYDKGTREAETILKRLRANDVADLNALMMAVKETHARVIDESEYELLEIAVETARKITNHALEDGDVYLSFVRNALSRIRTEGKVKVFVDEQTYNRFVQMHGPNSIQRDVLEIIVQPNPEYKLGDATITYADESINLSVDSQIEEIRRELGIG